jgi:hypothetical protein
MALDPRTWCWEAMLQHPLFVAFVPVVVGGLFAYALTERWQRWRQRREFQHRTLVKFSELTYGLMDLLAELLVGRRRGMMLDDYAQKRRELVSRWTVFASIRGEAMAAYGRDFVLTEEYQGVFTSLETLRSYVRAQQPVPHERFEPEQERFLAYREAVVANMVKAMRLLSQNDWKAEVEQSSARVRAADSALAALPPVAQERTTEPEDQRTGSDC